MHDPTDGPGCHESGNAEPPNVVPIRSPEPPPPDPLLEALRALFPAWFIVPAEFGGYRAEWKASGGLQVRVVHGVSLPDLHRRLEVIEEARADGEE